MEKKRIRKREKKREKKKGEENENESRQKIGPNLFDLPFYVIEERLYQFDLCSTVTPDGLVQRHALSLSLSFLERISPKLLSHCYVNTRVAVCCTRLARIEMEMEKRGSGGHGGGALGTHGRSVEREKAIDPLDRRERNLGRWKKLGRDFFQDSKGQAGEL